MPPPQSPVIGLLKHILFRPAIKHPRLQRLWSRLHTLSIFAMNHGGGGLIETSGEAWALDRVVRPACANRAAPVVFDVGANVGDYTRLVRRLWPEATVYAFEPSRAVFDVLAACAAAEGGRVRPRNLGLSDADGTADLYSYTVDGREVSLLSSLHARRPTQVLDVRPRASERVQVDTLDRFCEREAIERIDFLKLDVEGHELSVLKGGRRMLEEGRVSIIQFEFGPANIYSRTFLYDFWSLLAGDYDFFRIVPAGLVPITFYGEHLEVFLTTNYLAVLRRDR